MPTAREIRKRIRSVKNIAQITRALEAVSASRVRVAQSRAMSSRPYAEKAWEILLNIQKATQGRALHPLLTRRDEIKNVMMIVISSDRGLAGSYNTNILRVAERFVARLGKPAQYIAFGRKGRDTLARLRVNMVAEFSNPANPSASDVHPVAQIAIEEYLSGKVDEVFIAYTDFINMLSQRPVVLSLLPLSPYENTDEMVAEFVKETPKVTAGALIYEYEPNAAAILDEIVPRFTELQIYQAVLESQASEHAARMVAMRNASDNAKGLTDDLTLVYNKARQSAITSEILDIVGGANALQQTLKALAEAISDGEVPAQPLFAKPAPSAAAKANGKEDDLTRIEGIGPKIAAALKAAGLHTFGQLAQASEDELKAAIQAAGLRLAPSLPTWAEQASYAASGNWDGLKALQKTLVGGRKA
ncbi:MAG: ATP synthase F1 subunit gamma [Chloroflexi bacterium]|nr:ATP synthase F1 subunit gamma [Chloroflexota bacterium]